MTGDISRSSFRTERHYASVRRQQGRVQLDADGNEAEDIVLHRAQVTTLDVIGPAGAPLDQAGFGLTLDGTGKVLTLSAGRLYVDGLLVENEAAIALPDQPSLAGSWALLPDGPAQFDVATPAAGAYAVLLDVWQREVSALEQPDLLEPTLNGIDTTTRLQTVWQVKLMPVPDGTTCAAVPGLPAWKRHTAPSTGTLLAGVVMPKPAPNACDLSPSGGYQGLENQLYRVEIHDAGGAGGAGAATFTWAPDNASFATVATAWDGGSTASVASLGRDLSTGWRIGDTAELRDATSELRGLPGTLLTVTGIEGEALTFSGPHGLGAAASGAAAAARNVRVRRWAAPAQKVPGTGNALPLGDDGVVVTFGKAAGVSYRTGDFWTIPARTALANILWPGGDQPPEGLAHRWALLGRFQIDAAGTITGLTDCRDLFAPLTAMIEFGYAGGDGQQAEPRETGNALPIPLAYPLEASVTRGKLPVPGRQVRFTIEAGTGGTLGTAADGTVTTDADGIATCSWSLDAMVGDTPQRVVARLLDDGLAPIAAPVHFGARVLGILDMRLNGGDTQAVAVEPGTAGPYPLPAPLAVAVLRAGRPAAGQLVRFEVTAGGGTLDGGGPGIDVPAGADGIAAVNWSLTGAPGSPQGVRARLMKDAATAWGLPDIQFSAALFATADGGACCEATVGEGGQFATIEEAVKALAAQKVRMMCLCLQPGLHDVAKPIKLGGDDAGSLVIHGCGPSTLVRLRTGPIAVETLLAFEMRDLTLQVARGPGLLLANMRAVTLRGISAETSADDPLIEVERVFALAIEGCTLRHAKDPKATLVAIDSFGGGRRLIGNEIAGVVAFGGGAPGSVANLYPPLAAKAKAIDASGAEPGLPPEANLLTLAGNHLSAVVIGPKLAELMLSDGKQMPMVTRAEGNVLALDGTMLAGMAIIVQANSFRVAGENLLIGGMRISSEMPGIKIVANTGERGTVLHVIGNWEGDLNRPITIS